MDRNTQRRLLLQRAVAAYAGATCVVAYYIFFILDCKDHICREPSMYRDLLRKVHIHRIFYGGNTTCIDYLRMALVPFYRLASMFRDKELLKDTINVSIEEQLAMFLHIVGHNVKNRVMKIEFIRLGETISRYFNSVLRAICGVRDLFVRQPGYETPEEITSSSTWFPWFKDCMGLIDGTHIEVSVPEEIAIRFIGRKGGTTQNVLAACLPNKQFTYVLAGWERSAADFTVLKDALSLEPPMGLKVLPGKYYLVDAGYTTMPGFIAPYRAVRYHLREQHGKTPKNSKELFNLRHSSLRTKIEAAFGILKNIFKILCSRPFVPLESQIDIVLACCVLHNYILQNDDDDYFANLAYEIEASEEELYSETQSYATNLTQREQRDQNRMWNKKRENIAQAM